jgi:NAD-dependent oxidoreductase involved in siderophore biosynthesis
MAMIRKGKVNRHEKVTQVLLSGKPVTPDEIRSVFVGTDQEKVLYRLSTNIYNIRKDGRFIQTKAQTQSTKKAKEQPVVETVQSEQVKEAA